MSQTSSTFPSSEHQEKAAPGRLGKDYILTDDERRVFQECNQESFWYRCVPFSITSMALTQFLVLRGTLAASGRFGSLPKVAFAGVCGYIAGKLSYTKTCQEKFKRLDNSPLGEALRQRERPLSPESAIQQSVFLTEDKAERQSDSYDGTPHSYSSPTYSGLQNLPPSPGLADMGEEDDAWRKQPLSEAQGRNRGNYEDFLGPSPETLPPKREAKKNKYGDSWEE